MNTQEEAARPQQQRGKHWARRTHRVVAMTSLVFLILIASSGLVLNHADTLGLTRRHVTASLIFGIYGIEAPPVVAAFEAGGFLFAQAERTIYAGSHELARDATILRGAVISEGEIIVASADEFFVATPDAILIERFAPSSAGPVTMLGTQDERVIVATDSGYFEFDSKRMSLSETDSIAVDEIRWSRQVTPDNPNLEGIQTAALGNSLSWERVLVDLHSGRILPTIGRYVADLTALCVLYLCISGIIMWFRRR